jgi:hypothetical protein
MYSVPGYLKLRCGESSRVLVGVSFAMLTILTSGIDIFAMTSGHTGHPGPGHQLGILAEFADGGALILRGLVGS